MIWKFWKRNKKKQEQTSPYNTNPTDRDIDLNNQLTEIKEVTNQLRKALKEAATLNLIYGEMVSILVKYDLTKEQREDILQRFDDVETLSDARELHDTIRKELEEQKTDKSKLSSENIDIHIHKKGRNNKTK